MKVITLSFHNILIWGLGAFFLSNCYFNPIINSIITPDEKKENNAGLSLLAGLPSNSNATLQVTGLLKDSSGTPMVNTNIAVGPVFSSSIKDTPVSTTTTTNSAGVFLIKLFPGTAIISVTDANGNFLGRFTLIVTSTSATQEKTSPSPFTIDSLTIYDIVENVNMDPGFIIVSTNPANGATGLPILGGVFYISYVFSKPVDVSTLGAFNFSFKLGASESDKSVTYTGSGTNFTFAFGGGNIYNYYSYLITPTVGVKDIEGNSLTQKPITITTGAYVMQP